MSQGVLIEKKRTQIRPWNSSKKRPEIPWDNRIYALSLSTGRVVVLEEEWIPDEATGEMVRKPGSTPDNNSKSPEMTYAQAVALFDEAEKSGDPLTIAFARLYGRSKMTLDAIGELARLPRYYAVEEKLQATRKRVASDEAADEIFKAAGIDIPKGLAQTPRDVEEREAKRSLAKHVIGGVSQGEIKAPMHGRVAGRARSMGIEGIIGGPEAVPQ